MRNISGIIYVATCIITKKVYIGQTIQTLVLRKNGHLKCAFNPNRPGYNAKFYRAIRKYGKENFIWDVLRENVSASDLDILEIQTIGKYDSYNNGYNSTLGGNSRRGYIPTEETKKKMSIAISGSRNPMYGKHHTKETKDKIAAKLKGTTLSQETRDKISKSNTGREVTAETRAKISDGNKGKKISAEHKKKLSDAHSGRKFSDSHRKKISIANSGENHGMYGKEHSAESKRLISESKRKYFSENSHPFKGRSHIEETIKKLSGENCYNARLTWEKVREIREKYTTGKYTHQMLADEYGVSRTTATLIIQNKRWKNDPQQIKDNS